MIFCLPFLPAEHIPEVFMNMEQFNTSEHMQPIFDYVRRNWIESSVWKVQNWSVFGQSVHTNNDCEGWHRRLNVRAGVAPPFYSLLKLLHKEAGIVESQVRLVSEMKIRRLQRSSYRTMQAQIFKAWDSYREKKLSVTGLLKQVSSIYQPRMLKELQRD